MILLQYTLAVFTQAVALSLRKWHKYDHDATSQAFACDTKLKKQSCMIQSLAGVPGKHTAFQHSLGLKILDGHEATGFQNEACAWQIAVRSGR